MRVDAHGALSLSSVERFTQPFDYFLSSQALRADLSTTLLAWLETEAPWKLVETDFYEQYEFSFWDVDVPAPLLVFREPDFLNELKTKVESLFKTELGSDIDVAAHKLVPGQRIRIHNDLISGEKSYRLLIQLNRGCKDEDGGILLLFDSADPADIHKAFRPIHNSAIGFAVSPTSNHAVSTIHGGERFTLVYSFYGRNGNG
ncbi:MAG: cyclophane-containing peptide 2OG-Fe(II) oxygenase YhhC [Acidobacteriota bacterium]